MAYALQRPNKFETLADGPELGSAGPHPAVRLWSAVAAQAFQTSPDRLNGRVIAVGGFWLFGWLAST